MRLSAKVPLIFALWLIAEFAAFAMVSNRIGLGGALLLCLLTSLVGIVMLRRAGLSTALRLRRAMAARAEGEAGATREAALDSALLGVGALLLILPGFISDFAGLALAAPSVRNWISERTRPGRSPGGRGGREGPPLVDLDPQEWSRLDKPQVPSSREG